MWIPSMREKSISNGLVPGITLAIPPQQYAFSLLHSFPIILWRIEPHSLNSRIILLHRWQSQDLLNGYSWHQCLHPTPLHTGILLTILYSLEIPWCDATHQITFNKVCVNLSPNLVFTYALFHTNNGNNPINNCLKEGHCCFQTTLV